MTSAIPAQRRRRYCINIVCAALMQSIKFDHTPLATVRQRVEKDNAFGPSCSELAWRNASTKANHSHSKFPPKCSRADKKSRAVRTWR